ncbi:MAG: hypothetical protein REJ50_03080 [Bordetella sp.]|nr:hypothetical protein [Bordetella sp.]
MSFRTLKSTTVAFALALGSLGMAHAAEPAGTAAGQAAAQAQAAPQLQQISALEGKLTFKLPQNFARAPGDGETPDGGNSRVFIQKEARQVVVVSETPTLSDVKAQDNDPAFLTGAVVGFVDQQKEVAPDYKKTGEKTLQTKTGLGLRQVDATSTMSGTATISTSLLGASGQKLVVVQVVSRAENPQGHQALVKSVIDSIPATPQ